MKRLLSATAILLVTSTILSSQVMRAEQQKGKWNKLRKISEIALLSANAADAHSSWGMMEANPLLANSQGRFGIKGVAIKGAIVGGWLGIQHLLNRRGKHNKKFAIANFAVAGGFGAIAMRNHRLPRRLAR